MRTKKKAQTVEQNDVTANQFNISADHLEIIDWIWGRISKDGDEVSNEALNEVIAELKNLQN